MDRGRLLRSLVLHLPPRDSALAALSRLPESSADAGANVNTALVVRPATRRLPAYIEVRATRCRRVLLPVLVNEILEDGVELLVDEEGTTRSQADGCSAVGRCFSGFD